MKCSIFRSNHKDYTYPYLPEGAINDDLPTALQSTLGEPVLVIDLELSPDRKLASEDINEVMQNLRVNGFHLQLPPGDHEGDLN